MDRSQRPSDSNWHESADPVRGSLRSRTGRFGTPDEVELADGTRLTFERDGRGAVRSIASGHFQLTIDQPTPHKPAFTVTDSRGATDVHLDREVAEVRRGEFALRLQRDACGLLHRVEVPGLPLALRYAWDSAGGVAIGLEGRPAWISATATGAQHTFRLDTPLGGWEELPRPDGVTLRAWCTADGESVSVDLDHDLLARTVARRWSDGVTETFERDEPGHLTQWSRTGQSPHQRTYDYQAEDLAGEVRDGEHLIRELDAAGRVLSVTGPGAMRTAYTYDACGRRIMRQERGRQTRYTYDALGQLILVEDSASGRIQMEFDGLGRRLAVNGVHEHRDASGRLWSTTDASGNLRHLFVWLNDRVVARIDGPATALAEVYVSDPLGSPLLVVGQDQIERLDTPPFGVCLTSARPCLYGHFGNPSIGLIHFGGREYDPELGVFLTPDPWDGSAADPRRWAGIPDAWLSQSAEIPQRGAHPYALCRFDPVGRTDRDGHMASLPSKGLSVLNTIASFILVPTWAWPLTALSLFYFLPIDLLYGELIRGLFLLFGGDSRPMAPYTIANSIWATGSSRQGIAALGLNGILPSLATSGLDFHSERAVTIGNVIWIDRRELNRMARPSVLELPSLTTWNTDPSKESVIHVLGTGAKGKRFHAAYWSRGYGNELAVAPATVATPEMLTFGDGAFDGTRPDGTAERRTRAGVHLAKPFPLDFPLKQPETLNAQEFLFDRTAKAGQLELVQNAWFALEMDANGGLRANDFIEVRSSKLDPIHRRVALVLTDRDRDIVIVSEDLPAPYKGVSLRASRLIEDASAQEVPDWTQDGVPTTLKATITGPIEPYQKLARAERVRVADPAGTPPPPPPGGAPLAGGAIVYATVKRCTIKVKLSAPLSTAAAAGTTIFHALEKGTAGKAHLTDPATPNALKWSGPKGDVGKGDFVSITGGRETTFAHVTDSSDTDLTIELLAPKLSAAGDVDLHVLKDRTSKDETASVVTAGVDDIVLTFGVTPLQPGNIVHFRDGDNHQFRKLTAWSEIRLDLSDAAPAAATGAPPPTYKLKAAVEDSAFKGKSGIKVSELKRFLKWISGTGGVNKPADFGQYPAVLHRFWSALPDFRQNAPRVADFLAHVVGPTPFDPDFRASWTHVTVGPAEFIVLDHDLPIKMITDKTDVHFTWQNDPDDPTNPDSAKWFETRPAAGAGNPIQLEIREFSAGTTKRLVGVDEPRVCVPEHPLVADPLAEALRQHELHHALQATHWGPFMGGLPLGLIPGLDHVNISSLMSISWKILTVGQFDFHYEDWIKLLDPFTALMMTAIGKSDHEAPNLDPAHSSGPGEWIAQLAATASDLRTWVPLIGWVILILPDGPKSFLEQGASRASGDLYSTILSADDRFNRESDTRFFMPDIVPDYHSANISKPLGEVTRLMVFPGSRDDSVFLQGRANIPQAVGPPARALLGYTTAYTNLYEDNELVSLAAQSAALLHPDLYEPLVATPAALPIDGPRSSPGPIGFLQAQPTQRFRPRLRAFTPLPASVVRTAGFYFMPGSPAKFDFIAFYNQGQTLPDGSPNPGFNANKDARTQTVTVTITEGDVTFGGDKLAYRTPPATATPPDALATPLKRFITEGVDLIFAGQFIGPDPDDKHPGATQWEINLCTTAAAAPPPALPAGTVTATAQTHGWHLEIGKTAGDVRVRVFRIYRHNDRVDDARNDHAFDLAYPPEKYPALKNVRSYLDKDVWIPIRDFQFTVEDLPQLTPTGGPVSIDSESVQVMDLGLVLTGDRKPKVTVNWDRATPRPVPDGDIPVPQIERTHTTSAFPRGEVWQLKPLGGVLEEDSVYQVTVTFGKEPDNAVQRTLAVTVKPFIRLKGTAVPAFEAAFNQPCKLAIEGGTAPYKVAAPGLPADTTAVVNGTDVLITAAKAQPADKKVVLTVTDANGKTGRRTITVRKT